MPAELWAECAATSAYLLNRTLTSALPDMTPYEAWHGEKPAYGLLRAVGCLAYAHTHAVTRNKQGNVGKLGPQATCCAMIGYSKNSKAYRVWDLKAKKIITSVHVSFEERQPAFGASGAAAASPPSNVVPAAAWEDILPPSLAAEITEDIDDESNDKTGEDILPCIPLPAGERKDEGIPPLLPPPASLAPAQPSVAASIPSRVQPTFLKQVRADMDKMDTALARQAALPTMATISTDDPTTYEEAISRPDAALWIKAMQAEIDSLTLAGTYDVTELPQGLQAIGGKWVFRTKRGANGEIVKYKARWVAQGFRQKYGIDYNETFAPVRPL